MVESQIPPPPPYAPPPEEEWRPPVVTPEEDWQYKVGWVVAVTFLWLALVYLVALIWNMIFVHLLGADYIMFPRIPLLHDALKAIVRP